MNKVAKNVVFILGLFLLLTSVLSVNAFAEGTVAVSSSEFYTHQGETFTTTIYIPDGANIVDFDISLKYDTELLTLVNVEENDEIKGTVVFNTDTAGEVAINYTRTSKNVTSYLPLLDLTFTVDNNIGVGTYDCLSVDRSATYIAHRLNNSGTLDRVDFECEFAPLVIYEMGDVDLSRSVDIGDATYIRRHLAEFEGSILSDFKLTLADTFFDGTVDIADAVTLQRHLARLEVLYGNRVNITFYDRNGEKYAAKSVVYDGTLTTIPKVPVEDGYSGGVWSQSATEHNAPVYTNLQGDIALYAYYSEHIDPAMDYYKKALTNKYYSGDLSTNMSSEQELWDRLEYQEGRHANFIWSSSSNYILNSTTGAFTKPTYPQELTLTATIISYDANNRIEAEDTISFDYQIPGIYKTPQKSEIEDFLKFYFTDDTDDSYRVNYDVKLISKLNNTVIPVDGALYDNFEIRLAWYQKVNGTLQPISQIKRTTYSQVNDYVAVATFNGKPVDEPGGDGKIYIDDVEVTAIDELEIKNYIINQVSTMGTLATDGKVLWNNDTIYGTNVTWETGNADIAYISNSGHDQIVRLKDDAITGATLPINARVTYAVDGGTDEFALAYNLTVSCDNAIIKAPENMDPGLYKAIKMELEDTLGYRGDLTSAALSNVKFVNLDLSRYQEMAKEYAILRAQHPEQYPDDTYPEITSFRGLSYCKNLRTLNISGITVSDGSMNQIATLSYLEAFIARGCNLDNLSDGGQATLRNATELKLIDLTDNNFTSLDSVFAEGVRYGSLREVYLSKNRLTDINALSRAPMMTYLSLSDNGLTTEGTASIENYPYLSYLSLANNSIDSVEHLKGLKYLKELRLQNNNLTNVNDLRRLVNLEILYLGHNNIQDITYLNALTKLEVLYVNDNRLFDISALRNLNKLEVINVSNNNLNSLSVLLDYRPSLTEIYAENNNVTDFSFINGASKLHILMLSGNTVELAQENMVSWLANLPEMEVLTLSDIYLNDLSFLDSMGKLVRLDVAHCGLNAFSGEISNVKCISDRYETLRVLDISNNDFSDDENEILKLRNITLLTVLYADNISNNLDAYTLTYSMTELKYISLENCGISSMNWLYKFNNLVYVDLAGNNISDVNFEAHISNASLKTLDELYLDTNVPCTFTNAFAIADINIRKLSLEGVSVNEMERMPNLKNIEYLNISNTGLTNLTGADLEVADQYSIQRYTALKAIDVSHLETDISVIEQMPSIDTVYAIGATDSRLFYEDNLHSLQRLYNKGVTCYLYDRNTIYQPQATVEGVDILNLLDDISTEVIVAADNMISDNNPFMVEEINDFDITWTVSNSDNYEIVNNHLSVKDYTGLEDESLTITATIAVYPDQAPVSRTFTIDTHILRATPAYFDIDADGYSEQLTRDSAFKYVVTLKAIDTDRFNEPVKPVEDNITYSYTTEDGDGILNVISNGNYSITSDAPLGAKVTIQVDMSHTTRSGDNVYDIEQMQIPVTVASRTFTATFVMNGGTIVDANNVSRKSCEFVEDALIFEKLTYSKPGYQFKGWYRDSAFANLFSVDGVGATMPSENITLYAKWNALSYSVLFDANGGTVGTESMSALSDVAIGDLPLPTRQYYTFDGWFTDPTDGTQVTAGTKFARTEDITVYAHWTLNSFVVTLDANGGIVDTSSIRGYCGVALGELPIPTRAYYEFDGWYGEDNIKITEDTMFAVAEDLALVAKWTAIPLKVTLNAAGGDVSVAELTVYHDMPYGEIPTPNKAGYTFAGWYIALSEGEQILSDTNVKAASDHTLYAHWSAVVSSVTFDANGGSVNTQTMSATYDEAYGGLPEPTRNNYDFIGWYTAAEGGTEVTSDTIVSQDTDHTLYAHWAIQTVTIPNFSGQWRDDAIAWCNNNGIKYTIEYGYMWNYSAGLVVSNTSSSATINKGSTITLRVSSGPKPIAEGDTVYVSGYCYVNSGNAAQGRYLDGYYTVSIIYTPISYRAHPYHIADYGWVSVDSVSQRSGNRW